MMTFNILFFLQIFLPLCTLDEMEEILLTALLPYLHASSSCRSTRVHSLNVTGFAASHYEAPAHSIAYNLRTNTC